MIRASDRRKRARIDDGRKRIWLRKRDWLRIGENARILFDTVASFLINNIANLAQDRGTYAFALLLAPSFNCDAELILRTKFLITGTVFLIPKCSFGTLLRFAFTIASSLIEKVVIRTPFLRTNAIAGFLIPISRSHAGSKNLLVASASTNRIASPMVL